MGEALCGFSYTSGVKPAVTGYGRPISTKRKSGKSDVRNVWISTDGYDRWGRASSDRDRQGKFPVKNPP